MVCTGIEFAGKGTSIAKQQEYLKYINEKYPGKVFRCALEQKGIYFESRLIGYHLEKGLKHHYLTEMIIANYPRKMTGEPIYVAMYNRDLCENCYGHRRKYIGDDMYKQCDKCC